MSFVVGAIATAIELGTVAAIATAVTYTGIAMTVVGTITKSKELTKIGGVLSVAGGVASLGAAAAGAFGSSAASAGAAGELGSNSLWSDAASQATADASANAATNAAENITADSFSGAASSAADSAIGASSGIGASAPDLATQYEITAGGGSIEPTSFNTPAPTGTEAVGAPPKPAGLVGQATAPDAAAPVSASASGSIDVPKPSMGQSIKDWYNGLSKEAQSRVTTSLVQAGGQAVGGLFQGWTADQQLALQKEIQDRNNKMYDTSVKNANSVPVIQFKPTGLVNNATKGG